MMLLRNYIVLPTLCYDIRNIYLDNAHNSFLAFNLLTSAFILKNYYQIEIFYIFIASCLLKLKHGFRFR